ncbi:MAG: DUF4397 domain-containing protein [Myxococcota bacterium]
MLASGCILIGGDNDLPEESDGDSAPGGSTGDEPDTADDPDDPGATSMDPGDPPAEPPDTASQVRVLHLGVQVPAVDIFANGEGPVFSGLEFRNSTEFASVPPGDYTFEVSLAGTPAEDAVLAPMLTLEPDTAYTAVAIGDLLETNGAPPVQTIALVDDADGIDPGEVRVNVAHAAPAVGQVDIWEISGDEPVLLLENVDFAASATLEVPATALTLGLDVDDDAVPDLTFDADTSPLGGNQINLLANNDAAGNVVLVAQLPDSSVLIIEPNDPPPPPPPPTADNAHIRVMHLGVQVPAVDIFANGIGPVFSHLQFRHSTPYATVPAGDNTFEVSLAGAPVEDAVLAPILTLDAGFDYTAVAIGDLFGAQPVQAIVLVDDATNIAADSVRVNVAHAAPAVGQVDIWELSTGALLLENVDFGTSGTLDVPAAPLTLGLDANDDAIPDIIFHVDASPLAGAPINLYANNDAGGSVALVAQLPDSSVLVIDPI